MVSYRCLYLRAATGVYARLFSKEFVRSRLRQVDRRHIYADGDFSTKFPVLTTTKTTDRCSPRSVLRPHHGRPGRRRCCSASSGRPPPIVRPCLIARRGRQCLKRAATLEVDRLRNLMLLTPMNWRCVSIGFQLRHAAASDRSLRDQSSLASKRHRQNLKMVAWGLYA